MAAEVVREAEKPFNDADPALLRNLTTPCASYDPNQGRLEGTRTGILEDIRNWTTAAGPPTLFWLYGLVGCGKSAIATSVSKSLDRGTLGGSFFCKHDDERTRKPDLISHLAASLAAKYPAYGKGLVEALRQNPELAHSATRTRFAGLIVGPLGTLGQDAHFMTLVIVDALDESGTEESRVELVRCLSKMSQLVSWPKVFVTGRPNNEIRNLLGLDRGYVKHLDLFNENKDSGFERIFRYIRSRTRDSRMMNRDVVDLEDRMDFNINLELFYGRVYWATHLVPEFNAMPPTTLKLVDELLLGPHLLYWIEVLGLTGGLHRIMASMADLMDWSGDNQSARQVKMAAADVYRFLPKTYVEISSSTPHLYLLALPFGAANYATLEALKPSFLNTLTVAIDMNLWNVPCLQVIRTCGAVNGIPVSLDGRRVASGSLEHTVQIWDAQTGAALFDPLRGHSDAVTSVAFSSDGRRAVSGSWDATVRVWDVETGVALLGPLRGHSSYVTCVAFSSDGRRIASSSEDESVRVWDADIGTPFLAPLLGHSSHVTSVAFSPVDPRLVSGSGDKTVRLWDLRKGAASLEPLLGHSGWVRSVGFSFDGQRVVSGSDDKTVRVWDANTGALLVGPFLGHSFSVTSVAFSSDGLRVVSGSEDKSVRVWDARTGVALLSPLCGHSSGVTSVAFSSDAQCIVSGSQDMTVRIWDAGTGAMLLKPLGGHSSSVASVAFSSDGQRTISGSEDKTVRIWDARTGAALVKSLRFHSSSVLSVALSSDGELIVFGSQDATLQIWGAKTGTRPTPPSQGHSGPVRSVGFSSDCQRIVSGSDDKTVRVWDANTGAPLVGPFLGHSYVLHSPLMADVSLLVL